MNRILRVDPENRIAVVQPGVVNADLVEGGGRARAVLRARPVEPARLHARRQRGRELRRPAHAQVRHHHEPRARARAGAARRRDRAARLARRRGAGLRPGGRGGRQRRHARRRDRADGAPLRRCPSAADTLLGIFGDVVSACRAVGAIIASGLVPAALEIVDRRTIAAVEASVYAAGLPTDAGAVLLVELDGPALAVARQLERVRAHCLAAGAREVAVARDAEERQRFWRARKGAFGAMGRLAPDLYVHDAVVPRSQAARDPRARVRDRRPPPAPALERLPRGRRQPAPEHLLRPPRPGRAARACSRRARRSCACASRRAA